MPSDVLSLVNCRWLAGLPSPFTVLELPKHVRGAAELDALGGDGVVDSMPGTTQAMGAQMASETLDRKAPKSVPTAYPTVWSFIFCIPCYPC